MPAGRDPEHRCSAGERAPEHAAVAAGLPAGLVDVDDRRALDLLLQPRVRGGERLAGALDDRIHRPGRDLDPEQLPGELGRITTRPRLRTASVTTAAWSRGPSAHRDPAGGSAAVKAAHSGQHTRCSRCSVTLTAIGGSSATRRREGSATSTRSATANSRAHDPHRLGQCSTISSICSGGSNRRYLPSCPCCPPRLRPDPFPRGRGGADGGSCDGGNDESRELRFSRRSSSATRASRRSFAPTSRWFASTSSSSRSSNPIAVSRSPSRIASASARSTPPNFGVTRRVPAHGLNAYLFMRLCRLRALRFRMVERG